MENLKEKAIRGGAARVGAQAANFLLRFGYLMVLARVLAPKDFGLVGMATAITGMLDWFKDFGLSSAAIQSATITEEQLSTLFWINSGFGLLFALLAASAAPLIARFYHDPRLVGITMVLALGFLFNGVGVQHSVLMQRHMRFVAMSATYTLSLVLSTGLAIWVAMAGYGYWALVVTSVTLPLFNTIGCWVCTRWIPGLPHRRCGIRPMMHFGGFATANGVLYFLSRNVDKILLGRYCGAETLGIYGRGYQLATIPPDNLNQAAGEVAFSALSRLQHDRARFREFFLKGYSVILAMTLPAVIACVLFADDIVRVALGAKWGEAVPVLRLLSPTIFVFAVRYPLGWVMFSLGLVKRSLAISSIETPAIIAGCAIGLLGGAKGVAFGYSAVMLIGLVPATFWSLRDTGISLKDIFATVARPLLSASAAGAIAWAARILCGDALPHLHLTRLLVESGVLLIAFVGILFYVAGQKDFYLRLLREFVGRSSTADVPVESPIQ